MRGRSFVEARQLANRVRDDRRIDRRDRLAERLRVVLLEGGEVLGGPPDPVLAREPEAKAGTKNIYSNQGFTIAGAIQVETVFSWPGVGRLAVGAIVATAGSVTVASAANMTITPSSLTSFTDIPSSPRPRRALSNMTRAVGMALSTSGNGGGTVAGALAGGVTSLLTKHGVSDEDAGYYEERINSGGVFLSVDASAAGISPDEARDILYRHGGHNASRARTASAV